jgi:DNA-binding transcriptional LysR family regulator
MQHLRFLDYVDAVARAGSIRGAADQLHVAASAVNRRVQDLEEELGEPLFERLPRGVRLTTAGELFVAYARRRSADLEQVRSEIEALRGMRRGHVAIAGSQAVVPSFLPRAIVAFQALHPGITFDVKVHDRDRGVQDVLDFAVDLALVYNPDSTRGLQVLAQARQCTCAVVAPDHPLAGRASVRLKDCLQYPIVLPAPELSGRSVLDELLDKASHRPQPALVSDSFEMMRAFARQAQAVSFQIEIGAGPETGCVAVPLDERAIPAGRLVLASLRGRVLPVAAALFSEFLQERMAPL